MAKKKLPVNPKLAPGAGKRPWLRALESGKYKPGAGHLRIDDKCCCLGVACEEYIKAGGELEVETNESDEGLVYEYDGDTATLPAKVMIWLGLHSCDGGLDGDGLDTNTNFKYGSEEYGCLTSLNDHDKRHPGFKLIAKMIRKHAKLLFLADREPSARGR